MTDDLKQIEHLLTLFEEREQVIKYSTYQIFELIRPTVLDALCDLFEIPFEEIEWGDVEYAEGIVIVICAVWFDPHHSSYFLQTIFDGDNVPINHPRYVRIGFPITETFKTKEEIKYFLTHAPPFTKDSQTVEIPNNIKDNVLFDTTDLTEEQLLQLKMFNSQGQGVKH